MLPKTVKPRVRTLPAANKTVLEELIFSELSEFEAHSNFSGAMLFSFGDDKNLLRKIMEGIEHIETESDLLDTFGVWDETCSRKIFSFVTQYAPLIHGDTSHVGVV